MTEGHEAMTARRVAGERTIYTNTEIMAFSFFKCDSIYGPQTAGNVCVRARLSECVSE